MTVSRIADGSAPVPTDSAAAWLRLVAAVLLSTIGGVGMWSVVVALPAIQAEFGVDRAAASLPYTFTMLGFAGGGVLMGRLADRFGVTVPIILATFCARRSAISPPATPTACGRCALAQGLLIGVRQLGHLRAVDGRHLALVHAPARHRRGHRRRRQLSRRHDLAAGGAAFHRRRRLAGDAYRHRRVLRRHACCRCR